MSADKKIYQSPKMELGESEGTRVQIKGRHRAVIKKKMPDGSIEVTETPWKDNRVVDTAAVLFAGLLKKDTSFTDWGILQFAVGEGNASWDSGGAPTPSMSQTTLVAEFFRKAPDYVAYMETNPSPPPDYNPATGRTAIIETRMTYEFTDGPSPGKWIREQALFGGDATSTADSGIAFNFFNHNKIFKDDSIELMLYFVHEISIVP